MSRRVSSWQRGVQQETIATESLSLVDCHQGQRHRRGASVTRAGGGDQVALVVRPQRWREQLATEQSQNYRGVAGKRLGSSSFLFFLLIEHPRRFSRTFCHNPRSDQGQEGLIVNLNGWTVLNRHTDNQKPTGGKAEVKQVFRHPQHLSHRASEFSVASVGELPIRRASFFCLA